MSAGSPFVPLRAILNAASDDRRRSADIVARSALLAHKCQHRVITAGPFAFFVADLSSISRRRYGARSLDRPAEAGEEGSLPAANQKLRLAVLTGPRPRVPDRPLGERCHAG
jgi:hypothetical protein